MYILGLNAFHGDSSACIFHDGELIAAIEEERIRRVKHWAGLPVESIRFCLDKAGISLNDVQYVTISRDPKAKITNKILHVVRNMMSFANMSNRMTNALSVNNVLDEVYEKLGQTADGTVELKFVEHHRSHLASAFYPSPFEESALLSVDGMGDFTSTMMGYGENNKISVLDDVSFPHSIGFFYTSITQYLGFHNYGDEYKVMGLAPYGKPLYVDQLRDVILKTGDGKFKLNAKYYRHFRNGVEMSWDDGTPKVGLLYTDELLEKLGPARDPKGSIDQVHMDLAASVQKLTEELIFMLAENLYQRTGSPNLCLSGGVAQNSVANGKILENTSFKNLYVPPAGHDAGTAVGSSLYFYHHVLNEKINANQNWAYTGPEFSDEEIKMVLEQQSVDYLEMPFDDVMEEVTNCLVDGGVVGWFQGKAEFGPRALGNRSILVDPRRSDAKDLLNEKIKRRESFRPFAPSILNPMVSEFFESVDEVPYMEKVFKIREEKRELIPAVTHVDHTGRLQTVEKEHNPKYYALISAFYNKTNIPILLNTSFNENEPIVNSPDEALNCYLRTKMSMLVMGNVIIRR